MTFKSQHYDVIFTTAMAVIGLVFDGQKLTNVDYLDKQSDKAAASEVAQAVQKKIEDYLNSQLIITAANIELTLSVSPFQEKVLQQLQKIPYGETRTYGEIAKILKTSPRAVGNACRNNPLPIIIPCHRVVAAKDIGGYDGARSGRRLDIKRELLEKEGLRYYRDGKARVMNV